MTTSHSPSLACRAGENLTTYSTFNCVGDAVFIKDMSLLIDLTGP